MLLDHTITWADGTRERVQIGSNRHFILNGVKKRLVGMTLNHDTQPFTPKDWCKIWEPQYLAMMDKILAYLQDKGMRLVTMWLGNYTQNPPGVSANPERYGPVLDLIYKHKMLVIPHLVLKYEPEFNNLADPNWVMRGDVGRVSDFVNVWSDYFATRPNVVGVFAESEIDNPLVAAWDPSAPGDQAYTAVQVAPYMDLLTGIMRAKLSVPVLHNLIGTDLRNPEIKEVVLAKTDWPCFTFYPKSLKELNTMTGNLAAWLNSRGHSAQNLWAVELNTWEDCGVNLTPTYISNLFTATYAVAILWASHSTTPLWFGLFDTSGNPTEAMKKIANVLPKLQTFPQRFNWWEHFVRWLMKHVLGLSRPLGRLMRFQAGWLPPLRLRPST